MNITKDNFSAVLPSILELIPTAKYISFDEEMTGIHMTEGPQSTVIDSPQERYLHMRNIAAKYNMIQFGICLFHQDEQNPRKLTARPYNFYVIPAPKSNVGPTITLEMNAIDFNTKHGMDWQTWITKGVSYVTADDEKLMSDKVQLQNESDAPHAGFIYGWKSQNIQIPSNDATTVEEFLATFKEWYPTAMMEAAKLYQDNLQTIEQDGVSGLPEDVQNEIELKLKIVLPQVNSFVRKIIFQSIGEYLTTQSEMNDDTTTHYADFAVRFRSNYDYANPSFILLSLKSIEDVIIEEKKAERIKYLVNHVGVRAVYNAISSSSVPLIGHNCMFDVLFMMHAFDSKLPTSVEKFRQLMSERIPDIFDTKFLFSSPEYQNIPGALKSNKTHLGQLYDLFKKHMNDNKDIVETPTPVATDDITIATANSTDVVDSDSNAVADANAAIETMFSPVEPISYLGPLEIVFPEGFSNYIGDEDKAHEAGYDAYMTGIAFAHIASTITADDNKKIIDNEAEDSNTKKSDQFIDFTTSTMQKMKNIINGMQLTYHHSLSPQANISSSLSLPSALNYPLSFLHPVSGRPFVVTLNEAAIENFVEKKVTTPVDTDTDTVATDAESVEDSVESSEKLSGIIPNPVVYTMKDISPQLVEKSITKLFSGNNVYFRRLSMNPPKYYVSFEPTRDDLANPEYQKLDSLSQREIPQTSDWKIVSLEEYWVQNNSHLDPDTIHSMLKRALSASEMLGGVDTQPHKRSRVDVSVTDVSKAI